MITLSGFYCTCACIHGSKLYIMTFANLTSTYLSFLPASCCQSKILQILSVESLFLSFLCCVFLCFFLLFMLSTYLFCYIRILIICLLLNFESVFIIFFFLFCFCFVNKKVIRKEIFDFRHVQLNHSKENSQFNFLENRKSEFWLKVKWPKKH